MSLDDIDAVARAAYEAGSADGLREGMSEVERLLERVRRECLHSVETLTTLRDTSHELAAATRHGRPWRDAVERVGAERWAHHRRGAK